MKKLALLVTVAISTAVSAQRPPRKVIVETTSAESYVAGMITTDSVFRDYTFCEKEMYAGLGSDTSTFEKFWDFEYDYYDTLTSTNVLSERYVFDFRKGIVKHTNGSTREKSKITSFTYTGPYTYNPDFPPSKGSITVFVKNKDGEDESYSLDFDFDTLKNYYSNDFLTYESKRREYKVSKVTKK
jgi:hypothetical protein